MNIVLSWEEVDMAITVGVARRLNALKNGYKDKMGWSNDWGRDIEGAAGEIAFCKATDRYFGGSLTLFSNPDVGIIEIKTSSYLEELAGPLNPVPDRPYVLVHGQIPVFRLLGWCLGSYILNFDPSIQCKFNRRWVPEKCLCKDFEKLRQYENTHSANNAL